MTRTQTAIAFSLALSALVFAPISAKAANTAASITNPKILESAAQRVRGFTPKDQFDIGPRFPELVGRTFSFDIPAVSNRNSGPACAGLFQYEFDTATSNFS